MAETRPDPGRALAHPLWVGAFTLLLVNDHVLKGGNLVSGALTGKLSDFAILAVAPMLLAFAVRSRSVRSFAAAHMAVGVFFVAMQLSPAFSEAWCGLCAAAGWHVANTPDPWDLMALPVLLVSWRFLVPVCRGPSRLARPWRNALAGVGVLGCIAHGDDKVTGGFWDTAVAWEYDDIHAAIVLHNATGDFLQARIRALRPDVVLDCALVAEDPGVYLPEAAFDVALTWEVPDSINVPLVVPGGVDRCSAAILTVGDGEPRLVYWPGSPTSRTHPGEGPATDDAMVLATGDSVAPVLTGGTDMLHMWTPLSDGDGECSLQRDRDRITWTTPVPEGTATLTKLTAGVDGCFHVELDGDDDRWYLCVPEVLFPFAVGDELTLSMPTAARLDVARPSDGVRLSLSAAGTPSQVMGDYEAIQQAPSCDPSYRAPCLRVAASAPVHLYRDQEIVTDIEATDDPRVLADGVTAYVAFSERRLVGDESCGSLAAYDLEWALLIPGDQ